MFMLHFLPCSINEPDFQAATAAAAAAAASTGSGMQLVSTMDSIDSETSDAGQYPMENCGFMDPERVMRSSQDGTRKIPKYEWTDITEEFKSACSELNLGELAQDMLFGLFEAMSAIEMMDPKMDMGMGYNKNDSTPHTFESAVEVNVLKYVVPILYMN